ncbi:MAG: EamA family transporter [bacterium]|jgi:drug/metabolite transporter (DMT)-like permease|nr:EamA family transporter [bacterium]
MEPWFFYALLSAVFAGIGAFTTKISAHYRHHPSQATFYSMLCAAFLSIIYAFTQPLNTQQLWIVIAFAVLNIVSYIALALSRIEALKVIDATIYFPTYKVASAILILPVGVFLFNDTFTLTQLIGVTVGVTVPLLLINRKEADRQIDLKRGAMLILVGIIGAIFVNIATKSISHLELNMPIYMCIVFTLGSIFAHYIYRKTEEREHTKTHVEWIGALSGFFMFSNLMLYLKALSGNLTSVYIINSFSVMIVVMLSVIFFKEHLDLKKGLALVGTVAATVLLK